MLGFLAFSLVLLQCAWLAITELRAQTGPPQAVPPDEFEGLLQRQRERKELRRMLTFGWPALLNGLLLLGVWSSDKAGRPSPEPVSLAPLAFGLATGVLLTLLRLKEARGSSVLFALGPGLTVLAGAAGSAAYLVGLGLVLVVGRPSLLRRLEALPMPAG